MCGVYATAFMLGYINKAAKLCTRGVWWTCHLFCRAVCLLSRSARAVSLWWKSALWLAYISFNFQTLCPSIYLSRSNRKPLLRIQFFDLPQRKFAHCSASWNPLDFGFGFCRALHLRQNNKQIISLPAIGFRQLWPDILLRIYFNYIGARRKNLDK